VGCGRSRTMTLRELIYKVTDNLALDQCLSNFDKLNYEVVPVAELRLGYKRLIDVKVSEKNAAIVIIHEGS
jgi:hypothetical protein